MTPNTAFILASGNDILAYNIDGDFDLSALTPGTYTVYGLSYATFNTPASVTDYLATVTTIAEIIADDTDNGGTLCLDLTDAGEGQTASIIVNEPATATLIDAYPTICRTKTVLLSELQGAIGGSATSATWSVLEGDSNGVFSPGNVFGTATTFKPGANDAKRGYVTIVLKTNDPDGPDGPCPPAMDMIRIIVKNVDCGTFPWNGNE
ncbi:MAG: hypothetical protein IPJ74_14815 [Saprospiraceae bacterium]|nr:hypothetical protein [Saprospiraceae bacterium]